MRQPLDRKPPFQRQLLAQLLLPLAFGLTTAVAHADGGFDAGQRLDSATAGGPATQNGDQFGFALAPLGDLDGDGTQELAVGAPYDVQTGSHHGVVHIISLNSSGFSTKNRRIEGVAPVSTDHAQFGRSLANVGDVNGDGVTDLAVGEFFDFWILLLDEKGDVKGTYENRGIDLGIGSFQFSFALTGAGDVNGDGVPDLVAGDPFWSEPGNDQIGGLWVFFLGDTGKVIGQQQITEGIGVSGLFLDPMDHFGWSLANVGGMIAVGAPGDDDGASDAGAVYMLSLHPSGSVTSIAKISDNFGGLDQALGAGTQFGSSVASMGAFDGAGGDDLLVGGVGAGDGELWTLFLQGSVVRTSIAYESGDLPATYNSADAFAAAVAVLPDVDGNGFDEFVVGAPEHAGGGSERGAIFTLFPEGVSGAQVSTIGCSGPAASLFSVGIPVLGNNVQVSLDNPFTGAMNGGASAFLLADVSYPGCGLLLSGTHLSDGVSFGELYLLPPWDYVAFIGFYEGPGGNLATGTIPIPSNPVYLGLEVYVQGLLADGSGGPSGTNFVGLTEGVKLTIGS